jgi:hypothetical protein
LGSGNSPNSIIIELKKKFSLYAETVFSLYFGHTKKPFKVYTQVIALFSAKSARGRFNLCLKDRGILYPLTPTQSKDRKYLAIDEIGTKKAEITNII